MAENFEGIFIFRVNFVKFYSFSFQAFSINDVVILPSSNLINFQKSVTKKEPFPYFYLLQHFLGNHFFLPAKNVSKASVVPGDMSLNSADMMLLSLHT